MDEVLAILEDIRPDVDFDSEQALIDEGILDSLDIVNMIARFESDLGAAVPFAELTPENLNSAASIASLVERCK